MIVHRTEQIPRQRVCTTLAATSRIHLLGCSSFRRQWWSCLHVSVAVRHLLSSSSISAAGSAKWQLHAVFEQSAVTPCASMQHCVAAVTVARHWPCDIPLQGHPATCCIGGFSVFSAAGLWLAPAAAGGEMYCARCTGGGPSYCCG